MIVEEMLLLRPLMPLVCALALSGCQSYPLSPSAASATEGLTLKVQPAIVSAAFQALALEPHTAASVDHLVVQVFTLTPMSDAPATETAVLDAASQPRVVTLAANTDPNATSRFGEPVSFTGLKANATYRIRAYAYDGAVEPANLISTTAESADETLRSYTDVVVTTTAPATQTLRVRLIDQVFDGRSTSTGVAVTPGGFNHVPNQ
jgi:hypothetical protein